MEEDCTVYPFYLDAEVPGVEGITRVEISVPHSYTVMNAVRKALIQLTMVLANSEVEVSLDPRNFVPRIAKKTGRPKMDMPCITLSTIRRSGLLTETIGDEDY
jgi:hypothetical protein